MKKVNWFLKMFKETPFIKWHPKYELLSKENVRYRIKDYSKLMTSVHDSVDFFKDPIIEFEDGDKYKRERGRKRMFEYAYFLEERQSIVYKILMPMALSDIIKN